MDASQQIRHLLRAVQQLHKRGYERIRVAPDWGDIVPHPSVTIRHTPAVNVEVQSPTGEKRHIA